MKLCTYVVVKDYGFSPNPFHGYCTLAACTPNRRNLTIGAGDWIAGNTGKAHGHRLVYAMQVAEVLDYDAYFHDPRFQAKKPRFDGQPWEVVGDNLYHRGSGGEWSQAEETPFHKDAETRAKDERYARVYVATHFYYFGARAVAIPTEFETLAHRGKGVTLNHNPAVVTGFVAWLERKHSPGVCGWPRHPAPRPVGAPGPLVQLTLRGSARKPDRSA